MAFKTPNATLFPQKRRASLPARLSEIFKTIKLSKTVIDFTVYKAAEALDSRHS